MATPVLLNQAVIIAATGNITAGALLAAKIDLFANNTVFNPLTTVLADMVVANYTGYAQGTLTWDVASVADEGETEAHSNRITWRPTDAVTPNQIYGYYLTLAGALLGGGNFDGGPLSMMSALDAILTTVVFRPGSLSNGYVSTIS
jgi:hypothetical protein